MKYTIFNNVYGLARSLVALNLLIDLAFTKSYVYFPEMVFKTGQDSTLLIPNFFLMFGEENIEIIIVSACLILLLVIVGYVPQITGILHAWLAYSFFTSSIMIEGGNQIAQIITILLVPVTLCDKRINHWHKEEFFRYKRHEFVNYFCKSCLIVIGIQMSIVYFFAVAVKINSPVWQDGSAIYYWLNDTIFGLPETTRSFLFPLTASRIFSPLITWGVLVSEAILFAAFFMNPSRKKIVFYLGICFHIMIVFCHGLWSFFFAMAGGLLIYLHPLENNIGFTNINRIKKIIFDLFSKSRKKNLSMLVKSVVLISLLMASCSKSDLETPPSVKNKYLDSVYDFSSKIYYWSDKLPKKINMNFGELNTPEKLLFKYREYSPNQVDKWSFARNKKDWADLISGNSDDFGLGLRYWEDDDLRIAFVFPESDASAKGLKRGQQILEINNQKIQAFNAIEISQILTKSDLLVLKIKTGENISDFTIERKPYMKKSILHSDVFIQNGLTIGYINIYSFAERTSNELEPVFANFKNENIDKLIIDLRYNGGGLLPAAENLANLISCPDSWSKVFYETEYNDNYKPFGFKTFLRKVPSNLCLKDISIIISNNTASASEVLINSINPYSELRLIGTKTQGKLMGMHAITIGDYVVVPVAFKILNSLGNHDNFEGFYPDFQQIDDVRYDWGEQEPSIKIALKERLEDFTSKRLIKHENGTLIFNDSQSIKGAIHSSKR